MKKEDVIERMTKMDEDIAKAHSDIAQVNSQVSQMMANYNAMLGAKQVYAKLVEEWKEEDAS